VDSAHVQAKLVLDEEPFGRTPLQQGQYFVEMRLPLLVELHDAAEDGGVEGGVFEEDGCACAEDVLVVGNEAVMVNGGLLEVLQAVIVYH
jgi:hypothetical protein